MEEEKNVDYHVPNLERALWIIELLAKHPDGLTIAEMVEKLEMPRNSVFRITMTLFNMEYLLKEEKTRKFRLSSKLLSLGYSTLKEPQLLDKALGPMRDLRDLVQETVPIGVIHGNEGIVIDQVPGTHLFKFSLDAGRKFHLHTSAPGKAILAFMPPKEQKKILQQIEFKVFNERTIRNEADYVEVLNQVKENGYSLDCGEEFEGANCVGAPIFNRQGYPVAAIWITGPSNRFLLENLNDAGSKVKACALEISREMGYIPIQKSTSG